jgi:hypothetical protein
MPHSWRPTVLSGRRFHKPVPYTTMIVLPARAWPDGLVLVTICPSRACLPATLNPSSISASRALVKVMPTTLGTGTSAGAVEGGALAVAADVGVAAREAGGEAAGRAGAEAVAVLGRDAADVAGAATALLAGEADVLPAAVPEDCGEPWNRNAMSDPATSSATTPAIAVSTRPGRRGRLSAVPAATGCVMATVSGGWPAAAPARPGAAQPAPGWPRGS